MNGFKTIVGMIVLGIVSPDLVKHGFPALTPDQQTTLVAGIVASAAVLLRTVTSTPIFSSLRAWLVTRKTAPTIQNISPEIVQAIAIAVAREFVKQPTSNQEKTP